MSSSKVIKEAANTAFTQRIAYLALTMAHEVAMESPDTANHDARLAYANQVFRGEDKAMLLTMHVVSVSPAIAAALEAGTAEDVNDADIQAALEQIWESRSTAYGAADLVLKRANDILQLAYDAQNRVDEAQKKVDAALAQIANQQGTTP